ncbi:adenylate/guanylate cyclase domain-containing protein [Seonamhaeicola maritimus]|uniref:2Fe-2S iron-sulfur cluster binding domain-containing protein n=1 Tax=Seonamhaeicola maritimus TaxID=2591822 RepID=A0A5C7GF87_9FLAO|nr:adenylate/guanylate cyclase domain-containing protein [Seonamhaeicola maritimus]TXG35732.1 2Fe-2S iron-sulfur cluster binding domain-containing protein [Seonamhaeicola maritimus]
MPDVKVPIITYTGINQQVELHDSDSTLLECSIMNQIPHIHECGGNGLCTTCRIRVMDGHNNLNPRTLKEQEIARVRKWDPSIRLACQCYTKGDVNIQRLVWTNSEVNKLQLETVPEGVAEERAIAILFCDIRGFTKLASENSSFDVAHILNRFYTVLGDPILVNNGIIYQYVGDEIIGLFGVSGGIKYKNCNDAIRAALGMQYAIERLNHIELVDFDVNIKMGIGINFGKAYIGHLGHPKHKQFAVVGDPVNTASRIQSYNKEVNTNILVSDTVLKSLPRETVNIGRTFSNQMAGHDYDTVLHELLGFKDMDIQLELQQSLDVLLRNEEAFASKFYDKVFTKAPKVRALFKNNMASQGRLLTHMLGGIVYSMSRPEHLALGLKLLGQSHVRYGVHQEHYPIVLECLTETIEEELGEMCNPQLLSAWKQALETVTSEMKRYAK